MTIGEREPPCLLAPRDLPRRQLANWQFPQSRRPSLKSLFPKGSELHSPPTGTEECWLRKERRRPGPEIKCPQVISFPTPVTISLRKKFRGYQTFLDSRLFSITIAGVFSRSNVLYQYFQYFAYVHFAFCILQFSEKKRGSFNESALLFNEGTLQVSLPQFPPPPELSMIFMPVNLCYDLWWFVNYKYTIYQL